MRNKYSLSPNSISSPEPSLTLPALLSPKPSRHSSFRPPTLESPSLYHWQDSDYRLMHSPSPNRPFPSDSDYQRVINKLDQVVSGSELRGLVLTPGKPMYLELATTQWLYLRIKAAGLPSPLTISIKRSFGRVVCYVSDTVTEPDHHSCDHFNSNDKFLISAKGRRFKNKWVFIGLHCIETAEMSITMRIAPTRKVKSMDYTKSQGLLQLDELRKDAEKRKMLFKRVESILAVRKEELQRKCCNRDFVKENKVQRSEEDISAWREAVSQRREEALKRYEEALYTKKQRALIRLNRLESKRIEQVVLETIRRRREEEKGCLLAVCCSSVLDSLWTALQQHKEELASSQFLVQTRAKRYARRMSQATSIKKQYKENMLCLITFYTATLLPSTWIVTKHTLFDAICASEAANKPKTALDRYLSKGNCHVVRLIQSLWRGYLSIKAGRMAALSSLWDQAVSQLLSPNSTQRSDFRRLKDLQSSLQSLDKGKILSQYYRHCQRRYYRQIEAYVHSNDLFRVSMKAFVFTKRKPEEGCAPEFRYLPSTEDMQRLVQAAMGMIDI